MHPFDIIVTADDEKTLNENARACLSERDNNYFRQKYEIPAEIIGAQFKEGIEYSDIDTQYIISIDVSSYEVNDDIVDGGANVGRNDYIAEIGYAENNEGNEVPVFWKNDPDYVDEGIDYYDTYYYVGQEEFEGVVYDKWRKIESDGIGWEDDKQIYILTNVVVESILGESKKGYLENNLQSWEIKYSLDNDDTKYVWACDGLQIYTDDSIWFKYVGEIEVNGEKYYAWENKGNFDINNYLLSKTLDLKLDDSLDKYDYVLDEFEESYSTVISSVEGLDYYIQKGKGVVYYMKDDKGNECGYDFKNIIYKYGGNEGVLYLYYTFNKDGKLMDLSLTDISGEYACTDNIIKPFREEGLFYWLNSTIFNGTGFFNNILNYQNHDNFFSGYCVGNTMNIEFGGNIIGTEVSYNTFGTRTFNCEFEGYIFCQQFPSNLDDEFYGEGYTVPELSGVEIKLYQQNTLTTALNLKHIPENYINGNLVARELPLYNVENISKSNFNHLNYLQDVYFGTNIKTIGDNCFQNSSPFKLHLSDIDHWCGIKCESDIMENIEGLYTDKNIKIENLMFSRNVKRIEERTFRFCPVDHIYIPTTVEFISTYSFSNTKCKSITLNRLETEENSDVLLAGFFTDNSTIEKVTIISDTPLLGGNIRGNNIKQVVVRTPVENLPRYFSKNCVSLEKIYLPKSIKIIEENAISSTVKDIYYEGSQEEWTQVTIKGGNNPIINSTARTHYNYYIGTDGLQYNTEVGGKSCIANISKAVDGYVIVPKYYYMDIPVRHITGGVANDDIEYNKSRITHLILPDTIEVLGYEACRGCTSLEYINFEELPNLNELGDYSLADIKIKEFTVPNGVTELEGSRIFYNSSIEKLNLNNVISCGIFTISQMPNLKKLIIPKLTTFYHNKFGSNFEYMEADVLENLYWGTGTTKKLKTLIIKTPTVCQLMNSRLNLNSCPNLYVYVPDELVEEYKISTNWVTLADRIKPLSEYVEEQTND